MRRELTIIRFVTSAALRLLIKAILVATAAVPTKLIRLILNNIACRKADNREWLFLAVSNICKV